ncbi:hypothetical protein BDR22DRAFT_711242 [Usnea florida]
MGVTTSYLSYRSQKQSLTPHGGFPQQLHEGYSLPLILDNGVTDSPSIANLYTHLIAMEKDIQVSRAQNRNKEAVIDYLLQTNFRNASVKESTAQLQGQLLALKATIERTHKEVREINEKLGKAKDAIIALTTLNAPSPRSQSILTTSSNRSYSHPNSEAVGEDLIDLLYCSQEPSHAKAVGEDTTLLDDYYEDDSEIKGIIKNTTRDQLNSQFSDSEFESSSYIVHFTDSDGDDTQGDAIKLSTTEVQLPSDTLDSMTSLGLQNNSHIISENSFHSPPGSISPWSCPTSISRTPSLSTSNSQPLKDVHAELVNEAFSQLNVLGSDDSDLDKAKAIVSRLAGEVLGFEAGPSQPTVQASKEGEDLRGSTGDYFIEPRWSPERSLDSIQDRASAALINRRSTRAGARDVACPGFFKHGIHFVPRPTEHDFYRTVIISGLPLSVTMEALLENVRGGMVIDAKLLDTAGLTGSNTALVTFLHEHSALAFEDHAKKHRIVFNNVFAQVAVVPTPTWPIAIDLQISIEEGRTRCLEIHGLPPNISLLKLRQELTKSPVMKSTSLEYMKLGADGVLELHFSSIRAAEHSSAIFRKTLHYRGCTIQYVPDPCAQPLETLLGQHKDVSAFVEEKIPELSSNTKQGCCH